MTVAMIGKQLCILKYTSGSVLKTSGVKKIATCEIQPYCYERLLNDTDR